MSQKRQCTSDRLRDENDKYQCAADDQCDLESDSVEQHELGEITYRQCDAAQRRDSDLFPQCRQQVAEFDLPQGNTTDDRYTGLGTGITAGVHQHRDVSRQDHVTGKGFFIACDDRSRKGCRDHQEQQPGHSVLVSVQNSRPEVALVGRNDSRHLFDILGGLFLDDIDYVVDGDDTDHTVLVVHHGHCRKVVFLENAGRFFLVGKGIDTDDIVIHDFPDDRIRIKNDEIAQRHCTDQHSLRVYYITYINSLGVKSDLADAVNRVADCHVFLQVDILDRHNASRRVLRISEQMVDILAGLRFGVLKDLLYNICRHLLQKVCSIVSHQVVDDAGCFFIGKRLDDVLLHLDLEVCEYIRSNPLGQDPENSEGLLVLHFIHHGRDVGYVHVSHFLAQFRVLFLLQQFSQQPAIFFCFSIFHIHPP